MNRLRKYKMNILETGLLLLLFLIKALIYNALIGNEGIILKLSFISLTYTAFIIALLNLKDKNRELSILIAYSLISILMFINSLYFKHFNQLTSVVVLRQVTQVGSLGDSIVRIVEPVNFLLVLDIIPLIIYYIFSRKKETFKNLYKLGKKEATIFIATTFCLTLTSVIMVNGLDEDVNLSRQEFYTYHLSDIYNAFFAENEVENIDAFIEKVVERSENKEDKYFGIAEGRNVITIQVEALQNFVIGREYYGQEITPNLNKLIKEDSIYFDRYYQQIGRGNTSDAEFVTHNSLYAAMDGQTYLKYYENTYYGLPWILKDNGYSTAVAFHGFEPDFWNREKSYPYQGFDRFISQEDFEITEPIIGFGINDSEFFGQSLDYIKEFNNPFYAFLVTLSSHHPFEMPEEYKQISLLEEHEDTVFGNYIQSINYVDAAIGEFIEGLKAEGLYENAIINIYGDHFGLNCTDDETKAIMTEFLGYEYHYDEMMRVPLIIHLPDSNINETITTTGGNLDFLPTILNLLGIKNEKGIMLGQDLINATEGFVAQHTTMFKGSYIKNNIIFSMSLDDIFENSSAWNIYTREKIDLGLCREDYERAIDEMNKSNYILENDLLKEYIMEREKALEKENDVDK